METQTPAALSARPLVSPPELDAAELAWWERFAGLEEQFAWVQTPAIQRFLRGHYVRRIVELTPPDGRIADLGCGAGWLAVLLGKLGARQVVGIDFSPAQIARARKLAAESGVADRVVFEVASPADLAERADTFDVVIVHAFLHHLSVSEIEGVLNQARRMLSAGGRLLIFEPVKYPAGARRPFAARVSGWLSVRAGLLEGVGPFRRQPGDEERRIRELIGQRNVGTPPHGPSPKEMPFTPGEIPSLVGGQFRVLSRVPCMARCHWIAQESLLMELSWPRLARAARWPLLALARFLDRLSLRSKLPDDGCWVFEMFVCEPTPAPTPVQS